MTFSYAFNSDTCDVSKRHSGEKIEGLMRCLWEPVLTGFIVYNVLMLLTYSKLEVNVNLSIQQ